MVSICRGCLFYKFVGIVKSVEFNTAETGVNSIRGKKALTRSIFFYFFLKRPVLNCKQPKIYVLILNLF